MRRHAATWGMLAALASLSGAGLHVRTQRPEKYTGQRTRHLLGAHREPESHRVVTRRKARTR